MANLVESYKGRIALSEKYYAQKNDGAKMDAVRKMNLAECLSNTATFMNENFANILPTQMGDMGRFKRFCLDITTLTQPNLIVNDIFMVKPIPSISGYISYMRFALGTEKGGVGGKDANGNLNTVIQDPFVWEQMTEARMNYTGQKVAEALVAGQTKCAWTPVIVESFKAYAADGSVADDVTVAADGTINFGTHTDIVKVAYEYDNAIIPQAKLPTLVGKMEGITVAAKPRRIAVNYSQFSAFVSKNDYGIDFESTISQQAQAELQYQTDSEAVFLVKEAADKACTKALGTLITWVDEELDTISYSMKAEGFARAIEKAKMGVYTRTNRHIPNWMIVSPAVMPILTFVPGFQHASNSIANGPYVAGTVSGMKVIVHPMLAKAGKVCYLGVLGNDGVTAVGGYFPYMPLVPTQLLGFADGTMQQGFSSLYAMQILNDALLGKIEIIDGNGHAAIDMFSADAE